MDCESFELEREKMFFIRARDKTLKYSKIDSLIRVKGKNDDLNQVRE